METIPEMRERLKHDLAEHAFITKDERRIVNPDGSDFDWFFDIKGVAFTPGTLDRISTLFWDHLKGIAPFQIGGLETVAIALASGIAMKAQENKVALNSFYIRKSRKVDGMQRNIEGALNDEKVILVDDALNSGKSIVRQVKALKAEDKKVVEVCVVLAFRDPSFYEYFANEGIKIWSIFTIEDFPRTGGLLKHAEREPQPPHPPFKIEWKFESKDPEYFHVNPKSAPVCDDERVYFGADNGHMWALNQSDGSVAWTHQVLFGAGKKRIFSSPAIFEGMLYFGAYDGNFYALDAKTGVQKWINLEADWIGSSPCVAENLGLVYVGLEFGLWKKQGGIAAFDARTGEKKWWHQGETFTHSTPAYSKKFGLVVVGSEAGTIFAYNAKNGTPLWQYASGGAVKAGFAIDEKSGFIAFGSWDNYVHVIDARTGELRHKVETYKPLYSSPIIWNGKIYMGLLDKRIVCIDPDTGKLVWEFWTHSRVFATPTIINDRLYCGSNDGRLYEIDPQTGKEISFFQVTERIVNKIAHNPTNERFFLPTYANELYCLTRLPKSHPTTSA
ncbi:PQQ-binding-like beta-propeller repeat protein [Candidatus Kaiserbacteria bacterium]|nr:PQQ-binding-like beta-propeller repeat protein [Candidatus Kaiserbacteria bacterium]